MQFPRNKYILSSILFFLLRRFSYERRITLKRYSFIGSINLPQIFLEKKLLESWILKDGTACFILNIKVVKLSGKNSKNLENRRNLQLKPKKTHSLLDNASNYVPSWVRYWKEMGQKWIYNRGKKIAWHNWLNKLMEKYHREFGLIWRETDFSMNPCPTTTTLWWHAWLVYDRHFLRHNCFYGTVGSLLDNAPD